jgi:tetratricopeptide (TPR) repeat protein
VIILCSFPYRGEVLALKNRSTYNPAVDSNRALTADYGQQMEKLNLVEPNHRFWSANYLITSGSEELGFKILNDLIIYDPRNLNYLNAMAGYLEQKKQFGEAIKFRIEVEKYDPWNAQNILTLGKNYKLIGNYPAAKDARLRILSFASNHPIAEESKVLLTND